MDRNLRGILAGIIGGITMNIWSFFSYHFLHFAKLRFPDWSSLLILGTKPENFTILMMALITQILLAGFLGVFFAHAIPFISSNGYILKGAFYGLVVSFFIYIIPALFQHPIRQLFDLGTLVSDMIGGLIWGVTTIMVLKYLDDRLKIS